MHTPTGASRVHCVWTHVPLWITIGGITLPTLLTNVSTVEVSPWSEGTVWYAFFPFTHTTTTSSLGTFWMPISSPDHICSGELIQRSARTFS